jgi:NAD(P)-dependent dehydrogenase (short-subunit alcohol dehydrogenase family)
MDLTNRVALITGGRRLGGAIAATLAGRGADVALGYYRSHDEAEQAADVVREAGRRAVVIQADLRQPVGCRTLVAQAAGLGRLDVLINMASIYAATPFDELSEREWDASLAVDLRAAFLCAHAAVPHMRAAGGGRIINVSDWLAASGRPRYKGYLPYYVAKTGLIGLTEALALELAADRILVNAIAPGPILPPPDFTDEQRAAVARATPLGRWGGAEEICQAVLSLIESGFITGETIRVDGGRHIH